MLKLFALPIFIASALIFYIQPLVGKILLPHFGGTAGVWGACVLFFQICLLLGYIYAHVINKFLTLKNQIITHTVFLIISLLLLLNLNSLTDNAFADLLLRSSNVIDTPQLQILSYLAAILALPMILLSATSPLLQKWYSLTNLESAANPYPLYSISSIANIFGLLAYSFILEPWIGLSTQFSLWKMILTLMTVFLMICSYITLVNKAPSTVNDTINHKIKKLSRGKIYYWLLLSIIPSSMLLSVTQIITSNISSVPLLWIIPLVLYLLSFAIAFSNNSRFNAGKLIYILPFSLLILIYYPLNSAALNLVLTVFFIISILCHYKIYRTRPNPEFLTNFYLIISLGGILGSSFNTFIAPIIFNDYYEFHLMVLLSIPALMYKKKNLVLFDNNKFLIGGFLLLAVILIFPVINRNPLYLLLICLFALGLFYYREIKLFSALSATVIVCSLLVQSSNYIYINRNFYGKQVVENIKDVNYLISGSTVHSLQNSNGKIAVSYYRPIQDLIESNKNSLTIATIGLGAGTVACMKKNQDIMDFYEINPDMISIAQNSKYFTYLEQCKPRHVILGDARLKLAQASNKSYDVIIFDAFTGGAVPMHLITKEAIEIYLQKIKDNGIILLNISNPYLDLAPALFASAKQFNLNMYSLYNKKSIKNEYTSRWVVLFKNNGHSENIISNKSFKWEKSSLSQEIVWTDDQNTILHLIKNAKDFL